MEFISKTEVFYVSDIVLRIFRLGNKRVLGWGRGEGLFTSY